VILSKPVILSAAKNLEIVHGVYPERGSLDASFPSA
jgi:hypothetical protein